MSPSRHDNLEAALARVFEDQNTKASWFALTGGELLFSAGDEPDSLYLVRSGRLGVFRQDEDQPPQFLGVIKPGEPVGEMALIAGTPHSASVVALRDSEILALPREVFFEAVRTQPDVMIELSRLMLQRARERAPGVTEPSVFGFISVRGRPIRAFVDRVAAAIEAQGYTCQVIDHSALSSVSEWFSRVEDTHDFVLYVAELDEPSWANLCARQVDRLFVVGDALTAPPSEHPDPHRPTALQQFTDLILLRDPRMRQAGQHRGLAGRRQSRPLVPCHRGRRRRRRPHRPRSSPARPSAWSCRAAERGPMPTSAPSGPCTRRASGSTSSAAPPWAP